SYVHLRNPSCWWNLNLVVGLRIGSDRTSRTPFLFPKVDPQAVYFGPVFNGDRFCADLSNHFASGGDLNAVVAIDVSSDFSAHHDFPSLDVRCNAAIRANAQFASKEANFAAYLAID